MLDEKLLDGMNFGELQEGLDFVRQEIDKIEDELEEGEEDPRLDMLFTLADKIVRQMDTIIRQNGVEYPDALAKWAPVMSDYEKGFDRYTDAILADDTIIDPSAPDDEDTDEHVRKLLDEGTKTVRELDPLVREHCKDDPAALAEWEEIMRDFNETVGETGTDEESPEGD